MPRGNKSLAGVVIDNFDLNIFRFYIDFVIFGSFLRFEWMSPTVTKLYYTILLYYIFISALSKHIYAYSLQ